MHTEAINRAANTTAAAATQDRHHIALREWWHDGAASIQFWGHCATQIQRRRLGSRPKRRILRGFAAVEEVALWRAPSPPPPPPPPTEVLTRDLSEPLLVQR